MTQGATGEPETVHASAVRIGTAGVLVRGPSGSGKSSLCLQLIALGAMLIADDRTVLTPRKDGLWLSRPETLPAAIEARGVGLLPLPVAAPSQLRLVVDLHRTETDRLPPSRNTCICGHHVALLHRSDSTHFSSAILLYVAGRWSE